MSFKLRATWRGLTVASLTPVAVVADVCAFQKTKTPRAILRSSLIKEGERSIHLYRVAWTRLSAVGREHGRETKHH